jgi:hypothetical protein
MASRAAVDEGVAGTPAPKPPMEVPPVTKRTAAQLVLTIALLGFALVPVAFGAKGGNGGGGGKPPTSSTNSGTLALTSEYKYWPDTWEPNCMTEDDQDTRYFSGSLSGSSSTSYVLCGLTDSYTAGGLGVQSMVTVSGTLTDLTITAPDGTVTHGVNVGQGVYEVCVCPPYYASNNNSTNPLAGGTWTITLSGQVKSATWETNVQMTYVNYQQQNCPASEQNIISS